MAVAIVTGAAGLIGSETAQLFHEQGIDIIGIDNDMRAYFFGQDGSTFWNADRLRKKLRRYRHFSFDIRDTTSLNTVFSDFGRDIVAVVHTAAQPSHDWARLEPSTDFSINAVATSNLLEATRRYAATNCSFIFTSTNKVYGDVPNRLPFVEKALRWELTSDHPFFLHGIDETISIDQCLHSLFGASKLSADVMVQEYGHYFGMHTAVFRAGCVTGSAHSGARLHGFLSYLVQSVTNDRPYIIYGFGGKQVRDVIHARDLADAFWRFFTAPRSGEVYNIGGSRHSHCSILEAFEILENKLGRPVNFHLEEQPRRGDHRWWVTDSRKFKNHYPGWEQCYSLEKIIDELIATFPITRRVDVSGA